MITISKIETCYQEKHFWKTYDTTSFQLDSLGVETNLINLYPDIHYQKILGFGGAFTEASGYALRLLSKEMYQKVLKEYFGSSGLNYTFCRTTIGSCDFSLGNSAYLTYPDISRFSIKEDEKYLIPLIKSSLAIEPNLQFLASPWSPPAFMKTNQNMNQGGKLLDEYKQLWAEYLVHYVKAYQSLGISIGYMTIQNEPKAVQSWESCLYSGKEEIALLRNYLYPTFQEHHIPMKFLLWDHNKERLYIRAKESLENPSDNALVSGLAFHWYSGDHFENIRLVREQYPEKLLIATEGCTGYSHFNPKDEVKNAEIYAHDYLGNLESGANAQIDWNLYLDYNGGPNHQSNYCNSPIMINKENTNYIKNLSYYYIGHFSKYIKPGAKRIAHNCYTRNLLITAFENLDKSLAVIILNESSEEQKYRIYMQNHLYCDTIKPHSIITHQIWSDENDRSKC